MKNMKRYRIAAAALAAAGVLLTGCSTSVGDFAEDYMAGASDVLDFGSSSVQTSTSASDEDEEDEEEAVALLDSPADFTMDNDGNYSFGSVEGAVQYYIYLCDTEAVEDTDDYMYAAQMKATDDDVISGSMPFEFQYGSYLAKVFAVDEDNNFSAATVLEYEHTGEITTPRIAYSWDGAGTITFDFVNITAYEYSVVPNVEITVTDLSDGTETVILMDDAETSAYLDAELSAGEYMIVSHGVTDSVYVTNQTTDEYVVAESVELGSEIAESSDYETRATYTCPSMFLIDFTTTFDLSAEMTEYTWANVLTADFTRDTSQEDDWTVYFYVGEGTGDDGLYSEIAFKADGTCRMIARGGPYGGSMGGDQLAETGADGYEWVEATGSWSEENGVITFTVEGEA